MYTVVLDNKLICNFCRSIEYPIELPPKFHEDNQGNNKK